MRGKYLSNGHELDVILMDNDEVNCVIASSIFLNVSSKEVTVLASVAQAQTGDSINVLVPLFYLPQAKKPNLLGLGNFHFLLVRGAEVASLAPRSPSSASNTSYCVISSQNRSNREDQQCGYNGQMRIYNGLCFVE